VLVLLAMLIAEAPLPDIKVAREGPHYKLTVGLFRWSQGEAVNAAIDQRMKEICKDKLVEQIEFDFKTVDPENHLAPNEPPIERAIWDYWTTFKCVEPRAG
jgi:hypothetical protein